jgi:hypothetical protein
MITRIRGGNNHFHLDRTVQSRNAGLITSISNH